MGSCCGSTGEQKNNRTNHKIRTRETNLEAGQHYVPVVTKNKQMSDEDLKLTTLYNNIKSNQNYLLLVDGQAFDEIYNQLNRRQWHKNSKNALIQLLKTHMRFSIKTISSKMANIKTLFEYNISDYGWLFGRAVRQIRDNYITINNRHFRTLNYFDVYKNYVFSLNQEHKTQLIKLQKEIKELSNQDPFAVFYVFSFLKKACKQLESQNKSIEEINKKLQKCVEKMNKSFAPNSDFEADLQNISIIEQKQFNRIKSQKHNYSKIKWQLHEKDKKRQLSKKISDLAEKAKDYEQTLHNLTYNNCIRNNGFGFNIDLKADNIKDEEAIKRVKQKLLQQKIKQHYKDVKFTSKTIKNLRKQQFKYKKKVMQQIYSNLNQVQFDVTDLLRARCLFRKISDINQACSGIINDINSKKYSNVELVQIDNRLQDPTHDLVLKIKIQQIVSQFQLCLRFKQTQSVLYHKMYEINRSQMLSPVVQLYQIQRKCVNQYFDVLEKAIQNCQQPRNVKSDIKQKRDQLKKFIDFKQDQDQQSQEDENGVSPFDDSLLNIQKFRPQKVQFLNAEKQLRTSHFFMQLGSQQKQNKWNQKYLIKKGEQHNR